MKPLVSVILPTYNRKEFLPRCLDAVFNQSYQPLEVIVVDDGSTDGTYTFIRDKYRGKVRYFQEKHSGLPAIARNRGLEAAGGDYIAFCDSDDYWMQHKIEFQLRRMQERKASCSCSDAYIIGFENKRYLQDYVFTYSDYKRELFWNNFFINSSVVMHQSLVENKRFNTSPLFRGYEDYVLWLTLSQDLAIDFVNEPLLWYQRHDKNLSRSNVRQDALVHLRILLSQPAYLHHPLIWFKKLLRYTYRTMR